MGDLLKPAGLRISHHQMFQAQGVIDLCLDERLKLFDDQLPQGFARRFLANGGGPPFTFGLTGSGSFAAMTEFGKQFQDFKARWILSLLFCVDKRSSARTLIFGKSGNPTSR